MSKYMDVRDDTTRDLVAGRLRFDSYEAAEKNLTDICRQSQNADESESGTFGQSNDGFVAWVRGCEVSPFEKKRGYNGSFMRFKIIREQGGVFRVDAKKLPRNLSEHPERGPVYPDIRDKSIRGIVAGSYRYRNYYEALNTIEWIRSEFAVSKSLSIGVEYSENSELLVWIRGYEVEKQEGEPACVGNFAHIKIQHTQDGFFTLVANKITVDLIHHPVRPYQRGTHPSWGHPILRKIKEGRLFTSRREAEVALEKLCLEYPRVSRSSGPDVLHTIIWSTAKQLPKAPPKKVKLEINEQSDGAFIIDVVPIITHTEAAENMEIIAKWHVIDEMYEGSMCWQAVEIPLCETELI